MYISGTTYNTLQVLQNLTTPITSGAIHGFVYLNNELYSSSVVVTTVSGSIGLFNLNFTVPTVTSTENQFSIVLRLTSGSDTLTLRPINSFISIQAFSDSRNIMDVREGDPF